MVLHVSADLPVNSGSAQRLELRIFRIFHTFHEMITFVYETDMFSSKPQQMGPKQHPHLPAVLRRSQSWDAPKMSRPRVSPCSSPPLQAWSPPECLPQFMSGETWSNQLLAKGKRRQKIKLYHMLANSVVVSSKFESAKKKHRIKKKRKLNSKNNIQHNLISIYYISYKQHLSPGAKKSHPGSGCKVPVELNETTALHCEVTTKAQIRAR